MDRRSFLKKLGIGTAAVAVAPIAVETALSCSSSRKPIRVSRFVSRLRVGDYVDYTNFSQVAKREEIDKIVMQAAEELGKSYGEHISALYSNAEALEAAGW